MTWHFNFWDNRYVFCFRVGNNILDLFLCVKSTVACFRIGSWNGGVVIIDGAVSPRTNFRQFWILLDFDAPSLVILPKLAAAGVALRAFDPQPGHARQVLPQAVHYAESPLAAAEGADLLVVLTEWNEFRALAPARLKSAMKGDIILDLRNIWEPAAMRAAGFTYSSIGRP